MIRGRKERGYAEDLDARMKEMIGGMGIPSELVGEVGDSAGATVSEADSVRELFSSLDRGAWRREARWRRAGAAGVERREVSLAPGWLTDVVEVRSSGGRFDVSVPRARDGDLEEWVRPPSGFLYLPLGREGGWGVPGAFGRYSLDLGDAIGACVRREVDAVREKVARDFRKEVEELVEKGRKDMAEELERVRGEVSKARQELAEAEAELLRVRTAERVGRSEW